MRLADRFFAFWRLPAWTDAVQVLLWLMAWAWVAVLAALGMVFARASLRFTDSFGAAFSAVFVLLLLVWLLAGCWFVSEAYRGWRAGHPHGRGWAVVIAGLLLMNSVPLLFMDGDPGTVNLAARAVGAAFGVALLVAVFTTKPPQADTATTA